MNSDLESLQKQGREVGTWGRIVKARLRAAADFAGREILDIGCSTGAYVQRLRAMGYSAYGCDLLINSAWRESSTEFFTVSDSINLPFADSSFDTCIAFEVLEHLEQVDQALSEIHRVCRKNIILTVPNCSDNAVLKNSGLTFYHWTDKTHKQSFTADTIADLLKQNNFKVESLSYINPTAPDKLFFSTWHIPDNLCDLLGNLTKKIPFRKRYFMTILAIASKA
jgi:2-polyprenyl-3-methyl-5-hydroxy-6-metoxy-1,4-benzoquinol methylase